VGTAFGVRLRQTSVEVTVTEGKVRVGSMVNGPTASTSAPPSPEPAEQYVVAGEQAVIPLPGAGRAPNAPPETLAPKVVALPPAQIQQALAWEQRRLIFASAPLAAIVAEFNRYNERKLVIADPELAARRFGGTFEADDPDTFVQMLAASYQVDVTPRPGELVLRSRRPSGR